MPTIGVAIAIPEPWATELQDYRTAVGDTTAAMIPTHITLIPPTEVDERDLPTVVTHLDEAAVGIASFCVHLRGTGTFRPVSPVVFVTLVEGISQVELLASQIRTGPLAVELAHPFHPHVTIAHHLPDHLLDRAFEELADFECEFDVTEFHLYVHDDEAGWRHVFGAMVALPEAQAAQVARYLAANFPPQDCRAPTRIAGTNQVKITEWVAPTLGQRVRDPLEARDGAIWWTGMFASLVGRRDPQTGELREYKLPQVRPHFEFQYVLAFFRSAYLLGMRGVERWQYWRLLGWTLLRRPRAFSLAVTLAIYGHHFRQVCELHVQPPEPATPA